MQYIDNQEQSHHRISSSLTARRIAKMLFSDLLNDQVTQILQSPQEENDLLKAFLLWPPDLFAFTSTIMSTTGAYQLVVSPPGVQGNKAIQLARETLIESNPLSLSESDINSLFCWPPQYDIAKYSTNYKPNGSDVASSNNESFLVDVIQSMKQHSRPEKHAWAKEMRRIGFEWRQALEKHFNPDEISKFKYGQEKSSGKPLDPKKLLTIRLRLLKKLCTYSAKKNNKSWIPNELLAIFKILIDRFNEPKNEAYAFTNNGYEINTIFDINCLESDEDEKYQKRFEELKNIFLAKQLPNDTHDGGAKLTLEEESSIRKQVAIEHTNQLANNWIAFQALFSLHAIADEASTGLGIRRKIWVDKSKSSNYKASKKTPCYTLQWPKDVEEELKTGKDNVDRLFNFAEGRLRKYGTLSNVHAQVCRILPKRHTPELGITLRSVSNNLSYHRSSVDVKWINWSTYRSENEKGVDNALMNKLDEHKPSFPKSLSVLLLPWPLEISSNDFKEQKIGLLKDSSKAFVYAPDYEKNAETKTNFEKKFRKALEKAIEAAKNEVKGKIDMVILPEGALLRGFVDTFESVCGENGVSMYIAGVRRPSDENDGLSDNMAFFKIGHRVDGEKLEYSVPEEKRGLNLREESYYTQYKHHRWRLDHSQVISYDLGDALPPTLNWWEAIKIRRRRVAFINVGDELTVCPLICEDLARQDPIAELLRAVGPSLVVTILMDGPQRKDRWSSRYATVLAEDPGCAVLTLTSYGMVRRWHPPYLTDDVKPVIALWNDGHGTVREIETKSDSAGVLLSLTLGGKFELTADGRREFHRTNTLTLGAIHQVPKIRKEKESI